MAQLDFIRVGEWLQDNFMTLNISKPKYIAVAHRAILLPPLSLAIAAHTCSYETSDCSYQPLERVESLIYLGVIVDQHLIFKPHVEALVSILRKLIYKFKSLRDLADRKTIKMIYYAVCKSLIDYCITSWGGAAKTHLIEVEYTKRAILKIDARLPLNFPTADLYRE